MTDSGKPRTLMIYPPVEMRDRYYRIARWVTVPPQGLCFLGAVLRREGIDCAIIDANAEKLDSAAVMERVRKFAPDVVGLSAPTMVLSAAAETARAVKEWNPAVVTVLGGPHVSVAPEETMRRHDAFDYAVVGEGERTFPELLARPPGGVDDIPGLAFRRGGDVIRTAPRPIIENLDELPLPAYDMLPDLRTFYQHVVIRVDRMPSASVLISRGCARGDCIFCARDVYGRRSRIHGPDYIIELFEMLMRNWGIRSVNFEDEDLLAHPDTMSEVCRRMIDRKMDLTWAISGRVDYADEELLKLMNRAGCRNISFGIESGSPEILKNIKKHITLDQARRAVGAAKRAGMRVKGFFMIGAPGETMKTIRETAAFSRSIGLDYFQMSYTVPLPGTELYRDAAKWGDFRAEWDELNIWNPVFIPHGLSREILERESLRAFRRFYLRPGILMDFARRIFTEGNFPVYVRDGLRFLGFLARG